MVQTIQQPSILVPTNWDRLEMKFIGIEKQRQTNMKKEKKEPQSKPNRRQ
jgi:hypothetical protein